eukprot:TRINITY_DN8457_c0_g1_i3.p1 TRINITY_DN8457_c0_g1~~TRINITY_DN8457_c0_g1_i3.p1  ORF type:complete len:427 (+),score=33.48 TRINITY_DN8457_c0_g1_i3:31-1281(+)
MLEKSEKSSLDSISAMFLATDFEAKKADEYVYAFEVNKELHVKYIMKTLAAMPQWYSRMDSGQPWFLFWVTNTLDLLSTSEKRYEISLSVKEKFISYLRACVHPEGGFSGSPGMEAHVASTYAALNAIISLQLEEGYKLIDREKMLSYLLRLKHNFSTPLSPPSECSKARTTIPGSFQIHINGENDLRAVYCSLVVADVLNLLDNPALREGIGDFISSCQTYEGGIACVPLAEAHAGYTYCGLASLIFLKETDKINIEKLLEWTVNRQLEHEGGFNGRINKLVDSCYNFWLGSINELVDIVHKGKAHYKGEWLYNQRAVQGYTLICCQSTKGGLIDKPGKNVDLYHTCYSLSGMSIAQSKSLYEPLYEHYNFEEKNSICHSAMLASHDSSKLSRTHPLYNTQHEKLLAAKRYFAAL